MIAYNFQLKCFSNAFAPLSSWTFERAAVANNKVRLGMAENGPPQYDRHPASIMSNVEVGNDAYLIRVLSEDDEPVDYEPGHVLALEIPDPENTDEWLRGPYTVTRSDDVSFDVLYKVVGKKTKTFAAATTGDKLQFGGKFKVPILQGIQNPQELDRVVLISTGVGVGPQIGFIEQALSSDAFAGVQIDLYAGYRNGEDVCCAEELDALAKVNPTKFSWEAIISSEVGRTSDTYALSKIAGDKNLKTHYHLIGNGSMVKEFQAGLQKANIPEDCITIEMYFNHSESPRPDIVDKIANSMKVTDTSSSVSSS